MKRKKWCEWCVKRNMGGYGVRGIICQEYNDEEADTQMVLIRFDEIFDFIKFGNLFYHNFD